jgi:hypothetical protein
MKEETYRNTDEWKRAKRIADMQNMVQSAYAYTHRWSDVPLEDMQPADDMKELDGRLTWSGTHATGES